MLNLQRESLRDYGRDLERDRWERDSISRFRLDWRIRNREALKSRRFLSSNLRHVAQKR